MFFGSTGSPLRIAGLASLVAASAIVAGCGGSSRSTAPEAVALAPAPIVDRKLEALFTTLPPSTEPIRAANVTASGDETPPPVDPDDPEDGEPLPATPGTEIAGTDQKACTDNAQFYVADGTSNQEALLNRHVLCVKQLMSADVHLVDKDGVMQYHSGAMTLDTRWSVHGVHNKLEKKGTLSLRYNYTKKNDLPAPSLKVIAKIRCIELGGEPPVECGKDTPVITLASGATNQQEMTIPFTWPQATSKVARTSIEVLLIYTTDNSTPVETEDGSGSTQAFEPNFDGWILRCDVDQLRAGWKGCVFPAAPAVWTPAANPDTQYARGHIADVFAAMPQVPGLFKLAEGSHSTAMTNGQYDPLTRVGTAQKKRNRAEAKLRCATTDAIESAKINQYCVAGMQCDCDEYPPASAAEGAEGKTWQQYSVRKILRSDNQKAGAQLGAMYAKERVLIGDDFRMSIGNASVPPPSPPPTQPPATPGSGDATSSISVLGKEVIDSTIAGQETVLVTIKNIGSQNLVGPLQFYFRNLPVGVTVHNATFVRDGVPYITLNYMEFPANTSRTFQVNYSGGKLSFTPYVFRGEDLD